ncbi:MAG TPA: serine/threonine-protein kinase [Opitutaceae bacterium]|nr:serine/threonine-protein kinase [Opitutaceae bacterium]
MRSEEQIFHAALALPPHERPAFLARACAGDPGLQRGVEELLRAHDAAEALEHSPVRELAPAAGRPDEVPGDRIGRYRLLELIGEGGCGRVYMAEQDEPIRRLVALKIVKLGMDTREVIARFDSERQALALMEHPNIARVLDAGATATGRPFFVMELVRGVRITDFCDEHRLPLAERIALFIEVCHAVQHAHQKGIIHRDLKPSNILVTLHDGRPAPRIIDFGIAKALHGPLTDRTLFTAYAQFLGTPDYMSPEQAAMSDGDVDTRSDIYSLGVLLYELTTGQTPLTRKELGEAGLDEVRRRIREIEPPRPSRRLQTLDPPTLTTAARARGLKPAQFPAVLHGELDWIVMRCLEKDRRRRYDTAQNLAADLRRHLRHEPVEAGPPGRLYRLGKFVRRHRLPVTLGSATVMAFVAFTTVLAIQHVRLRRAERAAAAEAASSREVLDFLQTDLLGQAGAESVPVWDMRVRDMLDRAEVRLDERFAGRPLVEAQVRAAYAATNERLGDYARMQRHLEAAVRIRARELGPEHPETLAVQSDLARALARRYQLADAERHYELLLAAQRRVLGRHHPDYLDNLSARARLTLRQGRNAEALAQANAAHDEALAALGADHAVTLRAAHVRALVLDESYQRAAAKAVAVENLARCRRTLGDDHALTLSARSLLGLILQHLRDHAGAEAHQREVWATQQRLLGPDHPNTLIAANNLAHVLQEQADKLEEARQLLGSVVEAKQRVLGTEHPSTLGSIDVLALVLRKLGRLEESAAQFHFAAAAQERALGATHPSTLRSLRQLAVTCRLQNRLAEAEAILVRIIEAGLTLGDDHVMIIAAREELGRVLVLRQRPAEALPVLRQAQRDRLRANIEPNPERAAVVNALLGEALADLGRLAEAEPLLRESLREIEAIRPSNPELRMQRRRTAASLAGLLRALDRPAEAQGWAQQAGAAPGPGRP